MKRHQMNSSGHIIFRQVFLILKKHVSCLDTQISVTMSSFVARHKKPFHMSEIRRRTSLIILPPVQVRDGFGFKRTTVF